MLRKVSSKPIYLNIDDLSGYNFIFVSFLNKCRYLLYLLCLYKVINYLLNNTADDDDDDHHLNTI